MSWRLPEAFITWPNGQLSSCVHNGMYVDNIQRYTRVFSHEQLMCVDVGELGNHLQDLLDRLSVHLFLPPPLSTALRARGSSVIRLNASAVCEVLCDSDKRVMGTFYRPHNERLNEFLSEWYGRGCEWNASHYQQGVG